jgi:hypothetical protein
LIATNQASAFLGVVQARIASEEKWNKKGIGIGACLHGSWGIATAQSELEPNDTRGSANGMNALPTVLTGTLAGVSPPSEDYWSWPADAGTTYNITATGGSGPFPLDIGIEIQSSIGNTIVIVDNNGDNGGESFQFTATATETHYLVVFEATGTPNAISGYTINVSAVSNVDDWSLF